MTCDYIELANSGVQQLKPYEPGKPIEELERELGLTDIVKLASNENPLGASHKALHALKHLHELHLYPDGAGFSLKAALAEKLEVAQARTYSGAVDYQVQNALDQATEKYFASHKR